MTADHLLEDAGPRSPNHSVINLLASLIPSAIWFVHLNVSYLLVPPSCRTGDRWPFAAVTVVALVAMVPPTLRARRAMRRSETGELDWFLGIFGVAMSVLFSLVTLLVGASALLVDPCH